LNIRTAWEYTSSAALATHNLKNITSIFLVTG